MNLEEISKTTTDRRHSTLKDHSCFTALVQLVQLTSLVRTASSRRQVLAPAASRASRLFYKIRRVRNKSKPFFDGSFQVAWEQKRLATSTY
jgi:hypothetical protein